MCKDTTPSSCVRFCHLFEQAHLFLVQLLQGCLKYWLLPMEQFVSFNHSCVTRVFHNTKTFFSVCGGDPGLVFQIFVLWMNHFSLEWKCLGYWTLHQTSFLVLTWQTVRNLNKHLISKLRVTAACPKMKVSQFFCTLKLYSVKAKHRFLYLKWNYK